MAAQRFLPDEDRLRGVAGLILLVPGVVVLGWLGWAIATSPDGIQSYFGVMLVLVLGAALTIVGGSLAFLPKIVLEIDVESRTYAVFKRGKQKHDGPLDALGPLVVRERTRKTGKGGSITEYVVVPSQHSTIDVYCGKSSSKARRKMEVFAKAWGLSSQSLGGAVRRPDELDVALHERLRSDRAATKPVDIPSGCPVRIDVVPDGYTLTSTGRDSTSMVVGIIFLGVGLYPFLASNPLTRCTNFAVLELPAQIITVLLAGLAIVMMVLAARCFRDAFRPGSINVAPDGVRYRSRRMRFSEIEEVTANPIEIIGDRRAIKLPDAFCPSKGRKEVAHEITRLIVEVGSRTQ